MYIWKGFPVTLVEKGLPEEAARCKRCRFDPWVRKIPWRRPGKLTPVFLSGKSLVPGSLAGYKESKPQLK